MNNTDVPIWEKYTLTIEEEKKASDPRSDPRATVGKVVLPRPILTE